MGGANGILIPTLANLDPSRSLDPPTRHLLKLTLLRGDQGEAEPPGLDPDSKFERI